MNASNGILDTATLQQEQWQSGGQCSVSCWWLSWLCVAETCVVVGKLQSCASVQGIPDSSKIYRLNMNAIIFTSGKDKFCNSVLQVFKCNGVAGAAYKNHKFSLP